MSIENADQLETYSDTAIDFYELEEEDLPESAAQSRLINYLIEVLKWLYRLERCYITTNLAIYQAGYKPVAPDVALFKGVAFTEAELDGLKSWQMSQPGRPAPAVVFEISSEDTWPKDLNEKILRYQQLGAKEYFAYDPGSPQVWADKSSRLKGWRYRDGNTLEIQADKQGWLWSEELESWLKPDGGYLRLLDRNGQPRPTGEEAERAAKEAERAARKAEKLARQKAEKAAKQREEILKAKLREMGIDDPDSLLS